MSEATNHFLMSTSPLALSDAVAAIILVKRKGYLLQRRDNRPDIWYPGHWGLFGGAVEPGEDPRAALARELHEELALKLGTAKYFARFDFEVGGAGLGRYYRMFYVIEISSNEYNGLQLNEGAEMCVFTGAEILSQIRVSPYDNFALFLHYAQGRLAQKA